MLAEHALALARRGLWVFPCRPRAKEPATGNGYRDATAEPDLIKRWWQQEPEANIGIATGARSHVFVLDVDGADAEAELRKLEAAHGALPPTVEAITGRGRHLYFEWSNSPVRNSAGRVGPGLDIRGEGGYVLAPPSIHPTGRAYCWSVDSAGAFARAPQWLIYKAAGDNGSGAATPPSAWRDLARDGVSEGARNDTTARLAGYLLRRYIDPVVVLELMQCWNATRCIPPLPAADIERIVDSISGREMRRRGNGNG
jgi:Bifunctional DNA primase/polymerase, N-terminal/Primase C terminal 1 (PriCT-1)